MSGMCVLVYQSLYSARRDGSDGPDCTTRIPLRMLSSLHLSMRLAIASAVFKSAKDAAYRSHSSAQTSRRWAAAIRSVVHHDQFDCAHASGGMPGADGLSHPSGCHAC